MSALRTSVRPLATSPFAPFTAAWTSSPEAKDVGRRLASLGIAWNQGTILFGAGSIPTVLVAPGAAFWPDTQPPAGASPLERTLHVLSSFAPAFNPSGTPLEAQLLRTDETPQGATVVRAIQTADGIPIRGTQFVAHLVADGALAFFHGTLVDLAPEAPPHPLSPEAVVASLQPLTGGAPLLAGPARYYQAAEQGLGLVPVWRAVADVEDAGPTELWVHAGTGEVLDSAPLARHAADVYVADSEDQVDFTGVDLYQDSPLYCAYCTPTNDPGCPCESPADPELGALVAHMDTVYDFWSTRFGWLSYDGNDSEMMGNLRFLLDESTTSAITAAFWNGYGMDYPSAPPAYTSRAYFASGNATLDFVAHEFAHGFNDNTAQLDYEKHPGAIDEHLADCFAALVSGDWELFEDSAYSRLHGSRSVRDPDLNQEPWAACVDCPWPGQPDRWSRFASGVNKDGFLRHQNAGIGNKMCYLIGREDTASVLSFNGRDTTSVGPDAAAELFHTAQRYYLSSQSSYFDYAVMLLISGLTYDSAHNDPTLAATWSVVRAMEAVGLWGTPQEVPDGEVTDRRPTVTTHRLANDEDVLMLAYRKASTGELRVRTMSQGVWGSPSTPSCFANHTLLTPPAFAQGSSPEVDDAIYAIVGIPQGDPELWRAPVTNGAIGSCSVVASNSAFQDHAIAAVKTTNYEIVFVPLSGGDIWAFDSTGFFSAPVYAEWSDGTTHVATADGGVSAAIVDNMSGAQDVTIAFREDGGSTTQRRAATLAGPIDRIFDQTSLRYTTLESLLSSGGAYAASYGNISGLLRAVDSIVVHRRWPDGGLFTSPANKSDLHLAFIRDEFPPDTDEIYPEYPAVRAILRDGLSGLIAPERAVPQPIADIEFIGDAAELESAPAYLYQFYTDDQGLVRYIGTGGR